MNKLKLIKLKSHYENQLIETSRTMENNMIAISKRTNLSHIGFQCLQFENLYMSLVQISASVISDKRLKEGLQKASDPL